MIAANCNFDNSIYSMVAIDAYKVRNPGIGPGSCNNNKIGLHIHFKYSRDRVGKITEQIRENQDLTGSYENPEKS